MTKKITYADTGVNYDIMDPFKRMAQIASRETSSNINRLNNSELKEVSISRGESVYLIETNDSYLAHVDEGLGTKNLVADAMYNLAGKSYYDHIAQDTVAMIVNDMITLGALPISVSMHLSVGDSKWFKDESRCSDLVNGWKNACNLSHCSWGCGETATLKGIIAPETISLSGSAIGIIKPKGRLINPENIKHGDAIVFINSSGVHANGITMARNIADKLPDGYLTKIDDGRKFGDALLDTTHIYVSIIKDCLDRNIPIHYVVNITGHGWRKLMRARQNFSYIIEKIPNQLPIFSFLQKNGPIDDIEAYGNFNMGAGLALYVSDDDVDSIIDIANSHNIGAFRAGHIEQSDNKKVIIKPKNIEYSGSTLNVRI